jgi:hypothetical protein
VSWLLTDDEFLDAANGMRRGQVSPALYSFLRRVVTALARGGGLAPALSPTGAWDEDAFDEVLHEWLSDRLLPGGLARAFEVCTSPGALSRYLERALRNWLVSKSRSRHHPRLLVRTRTVLKEDSEFRAFVEASTPADEWWGLHLWDSPTPYQGTDSDLVKWAFSIGEFAPLRYTAGSRLADPVISNADLRRFLKGVLEAAGALLTLRHFDIALRERFAYAYDQEPQPLSRIDDEAGEVTPVDVIEVEATAREVLIELTSRQVAMLRGRVSEGLGLEQLASRHSVSRGTVDNELRRAAAAIRTHLLDDSRAEEVLETLFEIAFEEAGRRE